MKRDTSWIGTTIMVKPDDAVRCNRCNALGTWAVSETTAHAENANAYRIEKMAMLQCGHVDSHWYFRTDNK